MVDHLCIKCDIPNFRPIQAVPAVSPTEHEYESLVSSPESSCTAGSSQMQTLDVRIKVTRAVMRESGQFETEGGSSEGDQRSFSETSGRAENGFGSVYDNITVRDGQDDDSWQYQAKIPQVDRYLYILKVESENHTPVQSSRVAFISMCKFHRSAEPQNIYLKRTA